MSVYIDRVIYYELTIDGYQFYTLKPGAHTISITNSTHIRKNIYDESEHVLLFKYIAEPIIVNENIPGTLHFNIKSGETKFFIYEHAVEHTVISILLQTPLHHHKLFEVSQQEAINTLPKLRLSMEPFVRGKAIIKRGYKQ